MFWRTFSGSVLCRLKDAGLLHAGGLWIVSRTAKAAKAMKQEADALDVDYKEVDD